MKNYGPKLSPILKKGFFQFRRLLAEIWRVAQKV